MSLYWEADECSVWDLKAREKNVVQIELINNGYLISRQYEMITLM